jgi:hypothetical protein
MMGTRLAWSSLSATYLVLAPGLLLAGCGSGTMSPGYLSQALPTVKAQFSAAYLYVANQGNASVGGQSIEIFDLAHPLKGPIGSIRRHISEPDGIFIDGSGTLYVANADQSGDDKVTVYPRGVRKPSRIYAGAVCAFDAVSGIRATISTSDTTVTTRFGARLSGMFRAHSTARNSCPIRRCVFSPTSDSTTRVRFSSQTSTMG